MVNVMGIAGSPRRRGNSTGLLQAALGGARAAGARTELVYLNALSYRGCQGCPGCSPGPSCRVRDALTPVLAGLRLADVWLLASPIYFDGLSGQMKTFFDRCHHLTNASGKRAPQLSGPRAAGVIITYEDKSRPDYRRVADVLVGYLRWMGDFEPVEVIAGDRLGPVGALADRPELLARAEAMGKGLVEALRRRGDSP